VFSQNLENLAASLKQAFIDVDRQMRDTFNKKSTASERSGCTAIAVVVTPTHIVTANAGDSRACLSRGGKNVVGGSSSPSLSLYLSLSLSFQFITLSSLCYVHLKVHRLF
jgi:hypothetical protein